MQLSRRHQHLERLSASFHFVLSSSSYVYFPQLSAVGEITFESPLVFVSQEQPLTASTMGSPDVVHKIILDTSDDVGEWYQDVEKDLETYVRLSIAGQYQRAKLYFDDMLEEEHAEFSVVAQHADTLIDQGAFCEAEGVLLRYRYPPVRPKEGEDSPNEKEEERRTVLDLLLANARIYTRLETKMAAETVKKALQMVGKVDIGTETSSEKVCSLTRSV